MELSRVNVHVNAWCKYAVRTVQCTHTICWTVTLIRNSNEYTLEKKGLTMCSRDICTGQGGSSWSSPLRLDWSWDEAKAKSLKTTQVCPSWSSPLRLNGYCDCQAGGWAGHPVAAQGLYSLKLKPRGLSGSSPIKSDGSRDSQTGGWSSCLVA